MVRILVADDHALMRSALRELFELHEGWKVCAEAGDGAAAVEAASREKPDAAVLDLGLPVHDGLEVLRRIRAEAPRMGAVLYTGQDPGLVPADAHTAGAALVWKSDPPGRLIDAIRQQVAAAGAATAPRRGAATRLTPREVEILRFLAEGKTNWSTGVILGISERTVETHRANLMKKLALVSVVELVHYAIQIGLVAP